MSSFYLPILPHYPSSEFISLYLLLTHQLKNVTVLLTHVPGKLTFFNKLLILSPIENLEKLTQEDQLLR